MNSDNKDMRFRLDFDKIPKYFSHLTPDSEKCEKLRKILEKRTKKFMLR